MIKRSILPVCVAAISSLLFFPETYGQAEKAEAGIRALMQEEKVVGLAVAVVKNNKVVYTQSFGLKDMQSNAPLTDDCLFRIASISKSFSATAIMQLAESRKLSLEDDISDLVGFRVRNPKFPEIVITLRHVLSHRSSINDSQGYFTLDAINPDKNPDWAKCYNDYKPGEAYQYCNLNYNMVGTIIEKVSGERFDQYIRHHILEPLGLYGGYCVDSLNKSRFASIYEYNGDSARFIHAPEAYAPRSEQIANYVMGYSTPIFSPTGGMKISATGLAEYMLMHMKLGRHKGKRIISKKSARKMQTPAAEKADYGLAIMTKTNVIPGLTMKGHTGSAYGLYSAMFFDPEKKFGIVVISNGCDPRYENGMNRVISRAVMSLWEGFGG